MFLNKFLVIVSSSELPALEHRKLWCLPTLCWLHGERSLPIGLLVYWILFILSSNKDSHKRLDEFEFLQDPTKDL